MVCVFNNFRLQLRRKRWLIAGFSTHRGRWKEREGSYYFIAKMYDIAIGYSAQTHVIYNSINNKLCCIEEVIFRKQILLSVTS